MTPQLSSGPSRCSGNRFRHAIRIVLFTVVGATFPAGPHHAGPPPATATTADHSSLAEVPPTTIPDQALSRAVAIDRQLNELHHELLGSREAQLDRLITLVNIALAVLAILAGILGTTAALIGYLGIRRFQDLERRATEISDRVAEELEKIKSNRRESDQILRRQSAETAAQDPAEAAKAVADVRANPNASLVERAIADALELQRYGNRDGARTTWRAIARIADDNDEELGARAWFSTGYLSPDLRQSVSAYDRAIRLNPDYVAAYNNRGAAKFSLGHIKGAVQDYSAAIDRSPDFATPYSNRAAAKIALKQYTEAIEDCNAAIRINPGHSLSYSNRGNARAFLGLNEEAIGDYDEFIRLREKELREAKRNEAYAMDVVGKDREAFTDLEEATRLLQLDLAVAYHNRGEVNLTLSRNAPAIDDCTRAIELKDDYAHAYLTRGKARVALGRETEARDDLVVALSLAKRTDEPSVAASAEKHLGELGE